MFVMLTDRGLNIVNRDIARLDYKFDNQTPFILLANNDNKVSFKSFHREKRYCMDKHYISHYIDSIEIMDCDDNLMYILTSRTGKIYRDDDLSPDKSIYPNIDYGY